MGIDLAPVARGNPAWKPGVSGNPAGRPIGSRQKIAEAIIRDITGAWEKHGAVVLDRLAVEDPGKFAALAAGMIPRELQDPQRVAALQQLMGRSQNILAAHQQQVAQQQAQQQALQAQQRQQAEETFRQFAAEQDARVLTNDPPETVAAIRNGLLAEAKAAGISEKQLITVYNTDSAMRHSFVQNLIADGMRYRLAQRSVSRAVNRPIAAVQRPGVSEGARSDDGAYAAVERQFRGKDLNPKQAAELLIARRARS